MGTLYLVSTPIGNLGDLSPRAAETLASVSRILAEDTRHTRKLLSHLGLSVPLVSLHAHNEASRVGEALGWLGGGEDLALVSDAGTPLISDPGARLAAAVVERGHRVIPIPGPSAVLTALAASGLPSARFTFLGFIPRKGRERQNLLEGVARSPYTVILFESPERTVRLLEELRARCGGERRAVVARELTKLHEEFLRGTLDDLLEILEGRPPRGEVTLVVEGGEGIVAREEEGEPRALALARSLLDEGMAPSRAARELARELGLPRNRAYRLIQSLEGAGADGG